MCRICVFFITGLQDVEKSTLDLVLSSSTHTDAVQTIAEASKGGWIFLLHPLAVHGSHWSADEARKRVVYEPRLRSSVILSVSSNLAKARTVPCRCSV